MKKVREYRSKQVHLQHIYTVMAASGQSYNVPQGQYPPNYYPPQQPGYYQQPPPQQYLQPPTQAYYQVRREFLDIKYSLFTKRFKFVEKRRFIFLSFFDQANS